MNEKEIFVEVLQKAEAERTAYLEEACGKNPALREGVEALLHEHARLGSFIESPATALLDAAQAHQQTAQNGQVGPASVEPLENGLLGDYRIIREIGRGGMGVVYEGEQVSLQRKVAIKILPFAAMLDRRQLQRFQNEARAAASLRHPNIVQVHYVGCERAIHFYAMDYIEGRTLADLIGQLRQSNGFNGEDAGQVALGQPQDLVSGQLALTKASSKHVGSTEEDVQKQLHPTTVGNLQGGISTARPDPSPAHFRSIARLGVQVAEALDHAHDHGIIHRDVKPSNVIIDMEGKAWITDFGLARIENDATLTVTGDLLGTIRYMSPEQSLAKRIVVDHRTDVYSLGVSLYELSTLHPPFDGNDRQELLRQIAFDDPKAPRRLNKAIPAELEIIITKAMAKNPMDRYDTALDLAEDLKRFLDDLPIRARRPTLRQRTVQWSRRHKTVVRAAAILLVMATFGFAASTYLIAMEKGRTDQALGEAQQAERNEAKQKGIAEARRLEAEKERVRAEQNFRTAREAVDRLFTGVAERLKDQPHMEVIRRELLEDALEFYLGFLEQRAETPELQFETAMAHRRAGEIQGLLGEWKESLANHQASAKILTTLKQRSPLNVGYHAHLARSHDYIANASLKLTRFAEAETHVETGISISEALLESNPKIPEFLADLIKLFMTRKSIAAKQYKFAEFREYRTRVNAMRLQLQEQFPNYPVQLLPERSQAFTLNRDFKSLMKQEQIIRTEIASLEAKVEAQPKVPTHRKSLSTELKNLAVVLLAMDRFEELESLSIQAIVLDEKLVADHPEILEYHIGLGWSRYGYGLFLHYMGRESEATQYFRLAIATASKVLERAPDNKRHYSHLVGMLVCCPARQFRDPERAVQLATRLMQFDGEASYELALAHIHAKRYEEALHHCAKLQEVGGETALLAASFEAVAKWHLGNKEGAKRLFMQATKAIEEDPGRSRFRHTLEYRLALREREEMMGIARDHKDATTQGAQSEEREPQLMNKP